jgi:predicted permease
MVDLLGIFASAIGPIVAIAGVGYLLAVYRDVDPEPLNATVVYVLAPALVFHSLAVTALEPATLARIAVGVVAFTVTMWVVTEGFGRLTGEQEPMVSALVLVAVFTNAGNLGIPVSEFAFGSVGRQTAVLFLSVQSMLMYTLGVYIASRSGGDAGLEGVKQVFSIPLVYAIAAAILVRALGVVPPASSTAMQAVALVGNAAIPVMLLILGIELARSETGTTLSKTWSGTVLNLGIAPLVGVGVALVLGFGDPTVARVFVLETAMPAAITPLILVVEFADTERVEGLSIPEYISTCVLVTTLLSIPYLTLLIALLRSGILV